LNLDGSLLRLGIPAIGAGCAGGTFWLLTVEAGCAAG
jgi:hypothetical protein